MTVSTTGTVAESLCNGVTTSFPVPFQYAAPSDLVVELVTTTGVIVLSEGAHYFRTGEGMAAPSGVTTLIAYPSGTRLRRRRATVLSQQLDLVPNVGAPAEAQERALDRAVLALQEQDASIADTAERSLLAPPGEVLPNLPMAAARAGGVLAFDPYTGAPVTKPIGSFPAGPPGPANSTYTTLAELKAATVSNGSYIFAPVDGSDGGVPSGLFFFQAAGAPYVADDSDVIELDGVPLSLGALVRQDARTRPAQFGADFTGATDATDAVSAWLARGGELYIPQGDVYLYRGNLRITKNGTRVVGGGRLIVTPAVANREAIVIAADDCVIEGVTVANPQKANPRTGDQTYGISIRGHRNRVLGCSVLDFQMGIAVQVTGEYFDNVIAHNYVRVIGAGAGPTALTDSFGEDRGIGIADYGARTKIIGNSIEAANALYSYVNGAIVPGTDFNDCCLGIVFEALDNFAPDQSNPDISTGTVIMGNSITPSRDGKGRFRRCISIEGGRHAKVIGNFCRGWTWDGIWLVGTSRNSVVEANSFVCDTPASDRTGAVWGPVRAAILVYVLNGVQLSNARVNGNIVDARTNFAGGIVLYAVTGGILRDISVTDNRISADVPMNYDAMIVAGADTGIILTGNCVTGQWFNSLQINNTVGVVAKGGWLRGASNVAITCVAVNQAEINGVVASDAQDGFSFGSGSYLVRSNTFYRINRYALVAEAGSNLAFVGNAYENGAGTLYAFNSTFRAIAGNIGFPAFQGVLPYNPPTLADGAGATVDVPFGQAMPGDRVTVSYSQPLDRVFAIAAVKTAGTVSVRFQNWSGASRTLSAGTIMTTIERGA